MFTEEQNRVSEMVHQGKAFATKHADLSVISGIHVAEGENQILQVVLSLPHGHHVACLCTCTANQ